MEQANKYNAGWALPVIGVGVGANAKAHYYTEGFSGQSLCGKYTMLGGMREDDLHSSPDNCKACKEKLAKQRPELGIKVEKRTRVELTEPLVRDGWTYASKGDRFTFYGEPDYLRAQMGRHGSVLCKKNRREYLIPAHHLRVL